MVTQTVVETAKPGEGLLQLCEKPKLAPTRVVRDITENASAWQTAFDKCAARLRCLVWWMSAANREAPPAECQTEPGRASG